MKIGKGVEWAAHTCALLAMLPANGTLALETLAEFIGVTPSYLAKQMQMLSRANIVSTKRGVSTGKVARNLVALEHYRRVTGYASWCLV